MRVRGSVPHYEGHVTGLGEDGRATLRIGPGGATVPGLSPDLNRRVCHCATEGSHFEIKAMNRTGAGVGDRVLVHHDAADLFKNAASLLGPPLVCLALAGVLILVLPLPLPGGLALAGGLTAAGMGRGLRRLRMRSQGCLPVITTILERGGSVSPCHGKASCPFFGRTPDH